MKKYSTVAAFWLYLSGLVLFCLPQQQITDLSFVHNPTALFLIK